MRRCLSVLLLLSIASPALAADDATARYEALVAAARRGDQPIDWQALRFAYAATPGFDVLGVSAGDQRKKMVDAFKAGDDATALAEAGHVLDRDYVDIPAHVISDQAYHHLGDEVRAHQQRDIVIGLLRSIGTGDGRPQPPP
jgi:hypothetical protein